MRPASPIRRAYSLTSEAYDDAKTAYLTALYTAREDRPLSFLRHGLFNPVAIEIGFVKQH